MKHLNPLTIETAPEAAKSTLQNIQKGFGFIPNLMATFANAPAVLNGYMALSGAWDTSTLSPTERQIILLAVSVQNHCEYCKAAHSTILQGPMKVDKQIVAAIRQNQALGDAKLNALIQFTREVVSERGFVSENTKQNFLANGYSEETMMEVIVGVALKTISNYIDHLNPVEIDTAFKS